MASSAYLSHSFFFLLAFSLLPIHARELKSFNRASHNEFPSDTATKPEEIPLPALAGEQPQNLPPQSRNGFGLYGRRPDEYFPTNQRSSFPRTEYNSETPDDREANAFYPQDDQNQRSKETYGMSDTRAVENGKYFYDLNNQRHGEAYDPMRDNGSSGYGVFNYEGGRNGYGYGHGQEMEGKMNYQNQGINQEEYYDP